VLAFAADSHPICSSTQDRFSLDQIYASTTLWFSGQIQIPEMIRRTKIWKYCTNDLPFLALDKSYITTTNTSTIITLSVNGGRIDPVSYQILSNPSRGTLAYSAPNLVYYPNTDEYGTDSFTYKATDALGKSTNNATINIQIQRPSGGVFNHLKSAFYWGYSSSNSTQSPYASWAQKRADISNAVSPVTSDSIKYVNWIDITRRPYFGAFHNLLDHFYSRGLNYSTAFLHYSSDAKIPNKSHQTTSLSPSTQANLMEDRFQKVLFDVGETTWLSGAEAKSGSALKLSQTSKISLDRESINSQITDQFSLEAWVKLDANTQNVLILGWGSQNGLWFDAYGQVTPSIQVDSVTRKAGSPRLRPSLNTWTHLVGVGDARNGKIIFYVNGEQFSLVSFTPGSITGLSTFTPTIGGTMANDMNYLRGALDEVRLYNTALTQEQVRQRFNGQEVTTGLIGNWKFDEGAGFKAKNSVDETYSIIATAKDYTTNAFGDAAVGTYEVPICDRQDSALLIGHPWKFREINFTLSRFASGGWSVDWQYWDGDSWNALTVNDGTNSFTQSGKVIFTMPSEWSLNNTPFNLYYVRIKQKTLGTSPIARSTTTFYDSYNLVGTSGISGERYARLADGNVFIPGWDNANDPNGDEFVDDTEFSNRPNTNASGRLKYLSIIPSHYLSGRFITNFNSSDFINFIVSDSKKQYTDLGLNGLFIDNASGNLADPLSGAIRPIEYSNSSTYLQEFYDDVHLAYAQIKQNAGSDKVIINGNATPFYKPSMISGVDGVFAESFGNALVASSFSPTKVRAYNNQVKSFALNNKIAVLHSTPLLNEVSGNSWLVNNPVDANARTMFFYLSLYYLLKEGDALYYLNSHNNRYTSPWTDWFKAVEQDIGQPKGDFYVIHEVTPTLGSPTNLLSNSSFEQTLSSSDWANYNNPTKVNVSATPNGLSGKGLEISYNSPAAEGGVMQRVTLKPNTYYTLRAWAKPTGISYRIAGGQTANLTVNLSTSQFTEGSPASRTVFLDTNWILLETMFKTGNLSSTSFYVNLTISRGDSGKVIFDDVLLAEGNYYPTYVLAREFESIQNNTKSLVLFRAIPEYASIASTDITSSSEITVPLNDYYRRLNPDGTLGPLINSIGIKNYEGIILVKDK
jgi:hypothetical protein